MKCPKCVQMVAAGEESCRSCGYSLEVPDSQFGHGAVSVERLTDADGNFTQEERNAIGAVQAEFERRFPQLFLMVYVGAPPVPASPGQFGFWLLNHAAVPSLDVLRPNERGLVLVVNPLAGTAALTAGYFLENRLDQKELNALLRSGFREFGRGDYVGAVRVIARRLTEKLCQRAREAARPEVLTGTGSSRKKKWFQRTRAEGGEPDIPAPPGKMAETGTDPAEEADSVRCLSPEPAFSLETVEGEERLVTEGEEAGSGDKRAEGGKSWVADDASQAGRGAGGHEERAVK